MRGHALFAAAAAAAVLVGLLATSAAFARPRTDVVKLANGDLVTGEIDLLQRAQLRYETDNMGTVYMNWTEVLRVESAYFFRVRMRDGGVHTGRFLASESDGVLVIAGADTVTARTRDVVHIAPIGATFLEGLEGSLSLGASYTKASRVGQVSFESNSHYQTVHNFWQLRVSSITVSRKSATPANRQDASLSLDSDLPRETWFLGVSVSGQHNDELGVDLRLLFATAAGIRLIESNHQLFAARAGLAVNREWSVDSTKATNNVEALIALGYSQFKHTSPKTDIAARANVWPSLTTSGRVRVDLDLSGRHEVIKDFFLSLSIYDSYDSAPPGQLNSTNDYGFVTSIGWSY